MAKLSKKEIEKPDRFVTAMNAFQHYIQTHQVKFFIGLGILVVMMCAGFVWYFIDRNTEQAALKLYAQIFSKSAQINSRQANVDTQAEIRKSYEDLIKKYPGTKAALISHYELGNDFLHRLNVDAAIKELEQFIAGTKNGNELRNIAYSSLGYCYEAKKDYAKAIDMFKNAVQSEQGSAFAGMIYYELGGIYELQGKKSDALAQYKNAVSQKNDPLTDAMIKRKIADLS